MGYRHPSLRRGVTLSPVNIVTGHLRATARSTKVGGQNEGKPRWPTGNVPQIQTTSELEGPTHFTRWETEARELGNLLRVTQRVRQSRGENTDSFVPSFKYLLSICPSSTGHYARCRGHRGKQSWAQPSGSSLVVMGAGW